MKPNVNMQQLNMVFGKIAHNVDVAYSYMSCFLNTYSMVIDGKNVNSNNMFLTPYWNLKDRQQLAISIQCNNISAAKQMRGRILVQFIQEFKKFLKKEENSNRNSIPRYTNTGFNSKDTMLCLKMFGIENTDVFSINKEAQKVNSLRDVLKVICGEAVKRNTNIPALLYEKEVCEWLCNKRYALKNAGMQAAIEVFDYVFSWQEYSQIMKSLGRMNPAYA